MADSELDVSVGGTPNLVLQMGGEEESVRQSPTDRVEFDTDDLEDDDEGDGAGADEDAGDDADVDGDTDGDDEDAGDDGDLGDFDADDPEVVEKFDARYLTADGEFDFEGAFSKEYFSNVAKGVDGLNESTYAYLASRGIPKSTVKQVEAMAATKRDAEEQSVAKADMRLMTAAGGPEALGAALEWGKKGGYDKAAQDRFNKVMKGKDAAAKLDAVEALMARYKKANPSAGKPRLPARDATKGQGQRQGNLKPFANRSEYRKARDEAGNNQAKLRQVAQRLAASKFDG